MKIQITLFEMRKSQLHAHFVKFLETYSLNCFSQEQEQELLPPGSLLLFFGCRSSGLDYLDRNHPSRKDFLSCGPPLLWVLRTYMGRPVSGPRKEEEKKVALHAE